MNRNDRISLALAQRVADQLPTHPELIDLARGNLNRWMELNKDAPALVRNYREWLTLLDLPIPEIVRILTDLTDESQRLRSNSPFPGAIPYDEVLEIKKRIWAEFANATKQTP